MDMTLADRIRVGIVGATVTPGGSGWGANAHVPALQALPDYQLKAVCTAHEETARTSAEKFGAELAFHDMKTMVAHPDVDLVAVVVRVPLHEQLVMAAIEAGKPVCCEWPLGANLAEATAMADRAKAAGLPTLVGLQARSDPAVMYARDLVANGDIGDIVTVNLKVMVDAITERGDGRIWQGIRANGANPMTIPGGHSIDALCHILGEFAEVSARVTTRIGMWKHAVTGDDFPVDAPDTVTAAGVLKSGAEVSYQVASVPFNASGTRLEIYGRKGTLVLTSKSVNIGPSQLHLAIGNATMAEIIPPDRYRLVSADMAAGPGRNVGQAYARFASALRSGKSDTPDFGDAVARHALIDAMERSHREGTVIRLA
ncbi:putative oxidoreductase [alpha proteobacterium BAL199]|jgi:predicted dehydrogenase|nr:putative oxidoreductase [alpha proteobacterium BAL199]